MSTRRSGFTLRDLFIATAVVAAILGLYVVGLTPGHVGARRSQCMSSITQLSLAAAMYEASHRHYPGYCDTVGGKNVGYLVPLLPHLERMDLYRIWSNANATPNQLKTATVYLPLLVCPSDQPSSPVGTPLSYVANSGRADLPASVTDPAKLAAVLAAAGVFQDLTASRVATVDADYVSSHDGLAYTLMFSENLLPAQNWIIPNPGDAATARKVNTFVWFDQLPTTSPSSYKINASKRRMPQGVPASLEWSRPSSNHPGGVNAAFCDGHVMFLGEDIDYRVYKQLMTPDGAASGDRDNLAIDGSEF